MAITDLTGTTWTLKDALTRYPGDTSALKTYSVNITTSEPIADGWGGESKSAFSAVAIGYDSGAENNRVRLDPSGGAYFLAMGNDTKTLPDAWVSRFRGTFTITGGADATNAVLIAWLEGNAEEPPQPDIALTYGGETILELSQTATKTLKTAGKYCASDILLNYVRPTGGGGGPIILGALRPDAELVKEWTFDQRLVADLGLEVPAWSTSNKVLQASLTLEAIHGDPSEYRYFITERALTIPEYSIPDKAKGRFDYMAAAVGYEWIYHPSGDIVSIDGSKSYGQYSQMVVYAATYRMVYWASATAITPYTSNAYGVSQAFVAPTISSNRTIAIKSPSINMRGNATYFSQRYWEAMTDCRLQYIIELWRAPLDTVDGWVVGSQFDRVFADVRDGGTLT